MVLGMLGGRHGDAPGEEGSAPGVMVFVHTRPGQATADVDNTRSTTTVEFQALPGADTYLDLAADAAILTGLLLASGGPMNPFSVFFLVQVALAGVLLGGSRRRAAERGGQFGEQGAVGVQRALGPRGARDGGDLRERDVGSGEIAYVQFEDAGQVGHGDAHGRVDVRFAAAEG